MVENVETTMLKYILSVAYGANSMVLFFKEQEHAESAYGVANNAAIDNTKGVEITDDYGQKAVFGPGVVTSALLEDIDKSATCAIERHIHQMRTQVRGRRMIDSDPLLKTAAMLGPGGPSFMPPNMGGRA